MTFLIFVSILVFLFCFGFLIFEKVPLNYFGLLLKKKRFIPLMVLWLLIGFQFFEILQCSKINFNFLSW